MSGRPGSAAAEDAPAALDGHQPHQRRGAGAVRPHRHDAAAARRLVGLDGREVARRCERRQRVVADALDEHLRAEHRARPLPVPSGVCPATGAPWRSAPPRGRPPHAHACGPGGSPARCAFRFGEPLAAVAYDPSDSGSSTAWNAKVTRYRRSVSDGTMRAAARVLLSKSPATRIPLTSPPSSAATSPM